MNRKSPKILLVLTLLIAAFALAACDAAAPAMQATPTREVTETSQPTSTSTQTVTPTLIPTPTLDPNPRLITTLGEGMMSDIYRSPDGKMIVVGIGNDLRWFDSETFEELGSVSLGFPGFMEIAISSNNRFVSVTAGISEAQVVDLDRQEVVSTFVGQNGPIQGLVFTPDNRYMAYLMEDMRGADLIGLWNNDKNKQEHIFEVIDPDQPYVMSEPAISPDGTMLAAGCDYQVNIWDVQSGEIKYSFYGHTEHISSIAFSPDGKLLASGSWDRTVRLWDPITGKPVRTISGIKVEAPDVSFSLNGQDLIIGNWSGLSYVWNLNDQILNEQIATSSTPDPFAIEMHSRGYSQNWFSAADGRVVFSPDNFHLALGSKPILIWDLEEQSLVTSLEGDGHHSVTDLQYSPDGQWLAAEYTFWKLLIWDVKNEKVQIRRESGYLHGEDTPGRIDAFAFSPDSTLIAVGSETTIEIWDVNSGSQLFIFPLEEDVRSVTALSFSPDGGRLYTVLSGDDSPIAEIWDMVEHKLLRRFELSEVTSYVFGASDSNDKFFARNNANSNKSWIEIWNLETDQIDFQWMTPRPYTEPILFSSDGGYLIAVCDNELYVWDAITGQLVFTMDDLNTSLSVAMSSNNKILAIDRNGKVDLYDISVAIQQRMDSGDWENIPYE